MEKRAEPFFTRKPYFWPVAASANVWNAILTLDSNYRIY